MPIFRLFRFGQKKTSLKNRIFPKGLTHGFGQNSQFFFSLDLIKIRLEITLSEFAMKKETFLTLKNRIFQSAKNHIFFFKGVNQCFWPKNANFLFKFDQNKPRNNAF